jgi:hypothetical protein
VKQDGKQYFHEDTMRFSFSKRARAGMAINPVPDRIRVHSDAEQDLRLNPNTGGLAANDSALAYAFGDANFGLNPNIVGTLLGNVGNASALRGIAVAP